MGSVDDRDTRFHKEQRHNKGKKKWREYIRGLKRESKRRKWWRGEEWRD